jgi:hypothetical protein
MGDQRIPLVRPARFAGGGGDGPDFGQSGAPGMPQPGTQRARDLAVQYADDVRGRFTERMFEFTFPVGIVTGASAQQQVQIVSNRTSFVRLVAITGGLVSQIALGIGAVTDGAIKLMLAGLQLRLQINGEEDLTTNGQGSVPSTFAALFSPVAPWLWFAAPPRLRVSDQLQATVFNTFTGGGEGGNTLQPYLTARIVDDAWWRELYGT